MLRTIVVVGAFVRRKVSPSSLHSSLSLSTSATINQLRSSSSSSSSSKEAGEDRVSLEKLVREKCKSGATLGLDEALGLFRRLFRLRPTPSIISFNQLLGALVKGKHCTTVCSLSRSIDSIGVKPSIVTLSILINCFSSMGRVDLGFSVLGSILKSGLEPDIVTLNTLLKGLSAEGKTRQAMEMLNKMVKDGCPCDDHTYGAHLFGI